jgi:hypothetical protein
MHSARTVPLLVAIAIVLAAGLLHGLGTERWRPSPDLQFALSRLHDLPERVGDWQASPLEMDAAVLRQAGAQGWWLRRFTNTRTGEAVNILLLCGPTRHMAIHRPEDCYRGAGYEIAAPAAPLKFPDRSDVFWTACFRKRDALGSPQLRICWSWFADGRWQAPESPRLAFAGTSVLYKLYAIRELSEPAELAAGDSSAELLRLLVPELSRSLSLSSSVESLHADAEPIAYR